MAMGTGTTNSAGFATISLDTSMVADTADVGDGNGGAFNADIVEAWGLGIGMGAEQNTILTLGSTTSIAMQPDPNEYVTDNPSGVPSSTRSHEATGYSYVPVLAENSGNGIKAHFEMTHTSSATRQTSVQAAFSFDGSAPFSVGSYYEESNGRTYSKPYDVSGSYHRFVWANYRFWKWRIKTCGMHQCYTTRHRWVPHDWTGDLTDDNPNAPCNGCSGKVGQKDYTVPPYTTNYNYTVLLDPAHTASATRQSNINNAYGFELNFAGLLSVKAKATYGNITYVKWTALSTGCSAPNSRLLWGN